MTPMPPGPPMLPASGFFSGGITEAQHGSTASNGDTAEVRLCHVESPLRPSPSHLRFRNRREFSLRRSENHAKKGLTGRPRGFGSPRSWNFRSLRREPVRWLSGRKRRFAKALYPLKGTQGSNPCLTAYYSGRLMVTGFAGDPP